MNKSKIIATFKDDIVHLKANECNLDELIKSEVALQMMIQEEFEETYGVEVSDKEMSEFITDLIID